MKVSRSSWHYRLNLSQNGSVKTESRNSLCAYFWYTVYSIFKLVRGPLTIYFLAWALGFILISDTRFDPGSKWGLIGYPVGCLITVVVPGVILFYLFRGASWLGNKIRAKVSKLMPAKKEKSKVKKPKGLLASYLDARKKRICPLIEFKEE